MDKDMVSVVKEWLNSELKPEEIAQGMVCIKGARGSGRLLRLAERTPYGWDRLILQALRLRLRYPPKSCPDIDRYIDRLMLERDYGDRYYFTNVFDPEAVTIRRSK